MSKKHKKSCRGFNYTDYLLIAISTITGITLGIGVMSSAVRLKICVITTGIKNYKSIMKKKHDKLVLLTISKLNSIEVLISKALIDSNISHDEFILINNVLKEFYDMKEEIKNSNKNTESKNPKL